jgi:hypothetical protein
MMGSIVPGESFQWTSTATEEDAERERKMEATDTSGAATCNLTTLLVSVEDCCLDRAAEHMDCETCPG